MHSGKLFVIVAEKTHRRAQSLNNIWTCLSSSSASFTFLLIGLKNAWPLWTMQLIYPQILISLFHLREFTSGPCAVLLPWGPRLGRTGKKVHRARTRCGAIKQLIYARTGVASRPPCKKNCKATCGGSINSLIPTFHGWCLILSIATILRIKHPILIFSIRYLFTFSIPVILWPILKAVRAIFPHEIKEGFKTEKVNLFVQQIDTDGVIKSPCDLFMSCVTAFNLLGTAMPPRKPVYRYIILFLCKSWVLTSYQACQIYIIWQCSNFMLAYLFSWNIFDVVWNVIIGNHGNRLFLNVILPTQLPLLKSLK